MKKLFTIIAIIATTASACVPQKTATSNPDNSSVLPRWHTHDKKDLGTAD